MRIIIIFFLVFTTSALWAKDVEKSAKVVATVESLVGSARVKEDGSFRKKIVKVGRKIKEGDLLTTSRKSSIVLHLIDKSVVVLDASSAIYFGLEKSKKKKKREGIL